MATIEHGPYKFLEPYGPEDRDVFFGRDQETKVLLADILTTRLVVLFARTGTGKTSLINAGVRPLLHERGYVTFFIRVEPDPVRSAQQAIAQKLALDPVARRLRTGIATDGPVSLLANVSLPDQLRKLSLDLGEALTDPDSAEPPVRVPIVLFFDQFEEFFMYVGRENPALAGAFVADVASLHEDEESGIHLVFSMREEFLAEMEIFREEIPEIFGADSNLRLRWFSPEQAAAAVAGPAAAAVDQDLVRTLVDDLAAIGLSTVGTSRETPIEPAQLQIVCATLWRERADGRLTLERYRQLGGAQQIVDRRLVEELETLESQEELDLVWRVLPELCTERGTKWVRELNELARTLGTNADTLRALLARLRRAGLVGVVSGETAEFVELVHDYLAEPRRVDTLRRAVRAIWPRRLLREALEADELLGRSSLRQVRERLDELALSPREAELVVRSALREQVDLAPLLGPAERSGADVWAILRSVVEHGDEADAEEALAAASRQRRPEGLDLLKAGLTRAPVAHRAVQSLGDAATWEAADVLGALLAHETLGEDARVALTGFARSRLAGDAAMRAAHHLESFARGQIAAGESATWATAALGEVESVGAVELLEQQLGRRELARQALRSLVELGGSTMPDVAQRAEEVVVGFTEREVSEGDADAELIELLAHVVTGESVALLERLLGHPTLADAARAALLALTKSSRPAVAARASAVLAPPPPPAPASPIPTRRASSFAPDEDHFWLVANRLLDGSVVPFLGPGADLCDRPPDASWEPGRFPPSGVELASVLSQHSRYPHSEDVDLLRISQYVDAVLGERALYKYLHSIFDADYPPASIHHLLARLPALLRRHGHPQPIVLTTSYADLLERALSERDEQYDVLWYEAKRGARHGRFIHRGPDGTVAIEAPHEYAGLNTAERTVILKLCGSVQRGDPRSDSYVITEDNYIEYLKRGAITGHIPITIRERMSDSHFLYLGYGLRDWNLRVILQGIWGDHVLDLKAWAIQREPRVGTWEEVERRLWADRNVDILYTPLEDYVLRLDQALAEADLS